MLDTEQLMIARMMEGQECAPADAPSVLGLVIGLRPPAVPTLSCCVRVQAVANALLGACLMPVSAWVSKCVPSCSSLRQ